MSQPITNLVSSTNGNTGLIKPVTNYASAAPAFAQRPVVNHPSAMSAPIGAIKSQITGADGAITTTYHPPADASVKPQNAPVKGMMKLGAIPQQQPMPEVRLKDGKHHVPFRVGGHVVYMDSEGNMSQ